MRNTTLARCIQPFRTRTKDSLTELIGPFGGRYVQYRFDQPISYERFHRASTCSGSMEYQHLEILFLQKLLTSTDAVRRIAKHRRCDNWPILTAVGRLILDHAADCPCCPSINQS